MRKEVQEQHRQQRELLQQVFYSDGKRERRSGQGASMSEDTFKAKIQVKERIQLPKTMVEFLRLKTGQIIEVTVRVVKKVK